MAYYGTNGRVKKMKIFAAAHCLLTYAKAIHNATDS